MSTRGVIARPTDDGWEGRYHHFDSYPEGLGAELWHLWRARYGGDTAAMRAELIDAHPAGWSEIVGADWSEPVGFREHGDYVCALCGRHQQLHYQQYYPSWGMPKPIRRGDTYNVLGHVPVNGSPSNGPQCYCHGDRAESEQLITRDGDDGGTEYAYVLEDAGMAVLERRWNDGSHMVGMFGMGADAGHGYWAEVYFAPWTGAEPAWSLLAYEEEVSS